jgi:hypothetical protein
VDALAGLSGSPVAACTPRGRWPAGPRATGGRSTRWVRLTLSAGPQIIEVSAQPTATPPTATTLFYGVTTRLWVHMAMAALCKARGCASSTRRRE